MFAAGESESDCAVLYFFKVLFLLKFQKWLEQQALPILFDAEARVNDVCYQQGPLVIGDGVMQSNYDEDGALVVVVLDRILNEIEQDQLVFLPVCLENWTHSLEFVTQNHRRVHFNFH